MIVNKQKLLVLIYVYTFMYTNYFKYLVSNMLCDPRNLRYTFLQILKLFLILEVLYCIYYFIQIK